MAGCTCLKVSFSNVVTCILNIFIDYCSMGLFCINCLIFFARPTITEYLLIETYVYIDQIGFLLWPLHLLSIRILPLYNLGMAVRKSCITRETSIHSPFQVIPVYAVNLY